MGCSRFVFLISGFLIGGLIFDEMDRTGTFDGKNFLARRGFKIYPSFYILIGFTFVIFHLRGKLVPLPNVLSEIIYVQNYFPGLWNHTWSLAVEEHFYFSLALLFALMSNHKVSHKSKLFVWGLIFLILIVNILKLTYPQATLSNMSFYFTHLRIDGLLYGVLLSYLFRYQKQVIDWWRKWCIAPTTILALPFVYLVADKGLYDRAQLQYGFTLLYLFWGNILILTLGAEIFFAKRIWYLPVTLGKYSYSIYLWHVPCKFIVTGLASRLLSLSFYSKILLYILLSFATGALFFYFVEKPFLKLRDKYFPIKRTIYKLCKMILSSDNIGNDACLTSGKYHVRGQVEMCTSF